MRILRAAENRAMPWKNGDGTTYEIAVFPENSTVADFDWRISRALVSKPGPFSIFPGIDRSLSILSGKLALARGGDELIDLSPDSTPYSFPGEDRISGSPSGDLPVVDFNVMVRRDRCIASVVRWKISEPVAVPEIAYFTVIFVEAGRVEIGDHLVDALDCIVFGKGDIDTVRSAGGAARLLAVTLKLRE